MTNPAPDTDEFEAALQWSTREDEQHFARTQDGWNISLRRYLPHGTRSLPIVLGHGFAGSSWIFDLSEETSMAGALARAGFDTWSLDWRGRGDSWPDNGADESLQWCFDDFVFRDAPAAVAKVREITGAPAVLWVGMEESGIAAYAIAISQLAPIAAAVTMGSPMWAVPEAEIPGVTTPLPERDGTRYRFSMVKEVGPILAAQESEYIDSSFRVDNTDWFVTGRYFRNGVPDEASEAVDQYKDWVEHDTMRSRDCSVVWSDRADEFTIPVLVMVAAFDKQRPPASVERTFAALGSADKTFIKVGKEHGFAHDYGHDDLVAGRHARIEVTGRIIDWLIDHDAAPGS
ncbi:MAG: alpha/beta hydrolase [Acidimicrobiia bacterium]